MYQTNVQDGLHLFFSFNKEVSPLYPFSGFDSPCINLISKQIQYIKVNYINYQYRKGCLQKIFHEVPTCNELLDHLHPQFLTIHFLCQNHCLLSLVLVIYHSLQTYLINISFWEVRTNGSCPLKINSAKKAVPCHIQHSITFNEYTPKLVVVL